MYGGDHVKIPVSILCLCTVICSQNLFAEKIDVVTNVSHRMTQLHLGDVHFLVISPKNDRVSASPVFVDGEDVLWNSIEHDKKEWIKNPRFWTHISHGETCGSWRTPKKASLQVTVHCLPDNMRQYELDMDNWAPRGIKNPLNSGRHIFGEVVPHQLHAVLFLKKGTTNQNRIARTLDKIDVRMAKNNAKEGP
jgi:hypothetical protein